VGLQQGDNGSICPGSAQAGKQVFWLGSSPCATEHNVGADTLSKLGSTRAQVPPGVFVQELDQPSIKRSPQVTIDSGSQQPDREVLMLGEDWRAAFIDFIQDQRYQRELTPRVPKRYTSCEEARASPWSTASSTGVALDQEFS
jgi:hypothetical protein